VSRLLQTATGKELTGTERPTDLLLLRPLLDILQLARSVEYNLFLALVLLVTLLSIQTCVFLSPFAALLAQADELARTRRSIKITAKTVRLVYRVTKGTIRLGSAVGHAMGKGAFSPFCCSELSERRARP